MDWIEGDVPGDWGPAPKSERYRPANHQVAAPTTPQVPRAEIPYDPEDPEGWT